ncbi:helix-turn-helix transcriptional regulator [Catenibacterium mitsuokai]|uniref:helix-turn-helix transcriptional regulator n=1 Tax=Catenibacterium mitsuokai TaxID=100886 RepID=UPI003F8A2412
MTPKETAEKIYRLRIQKGLDARELSLKLGKDENYIEDIETCKYLPFISNVRDICDCLGYSINAFFNKENEKDHLIHEINEELPKCDEDKLLELLYLIKRQIVK